ncbi:hypothetical protein KY290_037142 [Solanum tuberosum]|uniref:Uncharacterized protein n=1 Tax=Solanum tuberosum TaxID=4113 RepID=A0ABQ7TWE3_SOLTU|nr:hypothetical protein KY290_037142 [Solanum tuberosum]
MYVDRKPTITGQTTQIAKDNLCTLEFYESNFVVKNNETRTLLVKGSRKDVLYASEITTFMP